MLAFLVFTGCQDTTEQPSNTPDTASAGNTPLDPPPGVLEGYVSHEDSTPVLGAQVLVYMDNEMVTGASTGPDGKYMIQKLPPGVYHVKTQFFRKKTKLDTVEIRSNYSTDLTLVLADSL